MDFHLTKEQLLVRKMYREFAENEVKPLAAEIDEEERFPMETVEKMAKLGMMGIENPDLTDGSACIVVKESFGNAFVPFLVDHYQTVYVVDYRYYTGSITALARSKGASDVLFVNNLSAIRGSYQIGKLNGVK